MTQQLHLIVITGLPGSGKSTLATSLQRHLDMPLISKDLIKEKLFDTLGWSDREWSKKIGQATYSLMDMQVEDLLSHHTSVLVEANFKPEFDSEKFQQWIKKYNCRASQIVCNADNQVLFKRFKMRAEAGQRHPGHDDLNQLPMWEEYFSKPTTKALPLDIPSNIIEVDTTDFSTVDSKSIAIQIQR